MKTANEIRQSFLDFFVAKAHRLVPSAPLVPANDPTLLFTNAGMVQFKDIFLGKEQASYKRAVSSQCCIRAGGKHNDLENVGYTYRHHTFFEMLGNFSFGDYFKREAIAYAWEYITEVLLLPKDRLWITVFDKDDEAARIWLREIGIGEDRLVRTGARDNFWTMGEVGPCGPCSEIFYDHGAGIAGGAPGTAQQEGDRYVELWNLVFMQHERDANGVLSDLPRLSVDTGMGLERIAAVMQGVCDNYQTDLFMPLIDAITELSADQSSDDASQKVIADHLRSSSFLIVDGVVPSNERRGYVLRRIIRRALRHGHKLGISEPFFYKLVSPLVENMAAAYPILKEKAAYIEQTLKKEEQRFGETLIVGLSMLDAHIKEMSSKVLPGDLVFKLYDTYGFPLDLTQDIAREKKLTVDLAGFNRLMDEQRTQAKQASCFIDRTEILDIAAPAQQFSGYHKSDESSVIREIFCQGLKVQTINEGARATILLDSTPFYGESGGQVGDIGKLTTASALFEVEDTQKQGDYHKHIGILKHGTLTTGEAVQASIDNARRKAIVLNHSATHLLHAALKQVLGESVVQKGSLVTDTHLRFDFAHHRAVSDEQIKQIEQIVNEQIRLNVAVEDEVMAKDAAMQRGAVALFGEKYGEQVRVLSMGDFSTELCGGTHVGRTGDIGLFKIVSEGGVAAGVRRIQAVTGAAALARVQADELCLNELQTHLKATPEEIVAKVKQLLHSNKQLKREIEQLATGSKGDDELLSRASEINGIQVLAARVKHADTKIMRKLIDQMKIKLGNAAIVLGAEKNNRAILVAGVSKSCADRISAERMINAVAALVDGKGGGRSDMAEAGGKNPAALDQALATVPQWVRDHLAA
ncbi:MAG: alanine--tRNA ligase [Chromatiales bacterium]|nr:alanine--tRNA ligase [Chromatiales bacterium]